MKSSPPKLIAQPIDEFLGDGAYDSQKTYSAIRDNNTGGKGIVTVPPNKNAVFLRNL